MQPGTGEMFPAPTGAEAVTVDDQPITTDVGLDEHQGGPGANIDACAGVRYRGECRVKNGGPIERPGDERLLGVLERGVCRVEARDAEWREQFGHPAGECRVHRVLGCPPPLDRAEVGGRQRLAEEGDAIEYGRAERFLIHRALDGVSGARRERPLDEGTGGVCPRCATGFGVVVIVAGEPEHGNHRSVPPRREFACKGHRGDRLVNGVERPAEESRLLASGDDERAMFVEASEHFLAWRHQRRVEGWVPCVVARRDQRHWPGHGRGDHPRHMRLTSTARHDGTVRRAGSSMLGRAAPPRLRGRARAGR